jgi:AcrR family transcriptional regulator
MTDEAAGNLSRKERERERHRREILEAAERVFVRKGYYLATVEQIAQEAQFAVGTIYNFFNGKEDLYAHVVEKFAQDFMEAFKQQVLTRSDPEEAIGALIELRLTHFEDHRGFFRVFFETSPGSRLDAPRALPPNCVGLYDRYLDAVSGIFKRGITDGLFDEMDPFYLTLSLEGIVNAFVAYWSRSEPSEPLATRVDKMRNAFLRRLRVGDPPGDKR